MIERRARPNEVAHEPDARQRLGPIFNRPSLTFSANSPRRVQSVTKRSAG